jgi:hypothetical protein
MKKTKDYEELSDYEKFSGACEGLKDVLNEKLCDNFLMITNRYVEGAIQKEREKVIPPDLAELQSMFLEYKCFNDMAKNGRGPGSKHHLEVIIKRIKEIYG